MAGAVIFDFNGVLFWDTDIHEEAWRRFSAELRGYPLSDEEMTIHVHGRVNQDIFSHVLGRPVSAAESDELSEVKERLYREMCRNAPDRMQLSPGAAELLDWLQANNVPRTIATSSAWDNVSFYIENLGLGRWFDLAKLVFDRGQYPGKPAPYIYLEAARALEARPADCLVVEDSLSGIASAHAANIGHIVALGPIGEHARLRAQPGVGDTIENLGQFPRDRLSSAAST